MRASAFIYALALAPLVAAHGKVAVVSGDLGGNGTALGIKGAVVPGAGSNSKTEVDTTVFKSKNIRTDNDNGYTEAAGSNKLTDLSKAMAQSGSTLPQVSSGGSINGTFHIVTTDGAGPLEALVDESASGQWSSAKQATVSTQPPGTKGNIKAPKSNNRRLLSRMYLSKRAQNVNEDYPFAVEIPAGTSCNGTINGISNLCLVKVSNNNAAGPFGGVFAVQMPGASSSTSTGATTSASASTSTASTNSNAQTTKSKGSKSKGTTN